MKKILLITVVQEATDRKCWSGIPFSIYQQLKDHYEIDTLCIPTNSSLLAALEVLPARYITKRFNSVQFTKAFAHRASKLVQQRLNSGHYDCAISFSVRSSGAIAYVKTDVPIIFFSDCVMSRMINYYWYVDSFFARQMNDIQQLALRKASRILLTSKWAEESAIEDYNVDQTKVKVVHFGANVELHDFKKVPHKGINLLFVGVDGKRKGVDVAIECVKWLNKLDPETSYRLDIVGCSPDCEKDPNIVIYGFINRNNEQERNKLDSLRSLCDFFILPTRAECAGIVFNEAGAYSTPSISYRTGGVPDYIIDGVNGILMEPGASGKEFAERILGILADKGRLQEMSRNAYQMYCDEYNWEVTGNAFRSTIEAIS